MLESFLYENPESSFGASLLKDFCVSKDGGLIRYLLRAYIYVGKRWYRAISSSFIG